MSDDLTEIDEAGLLHRIVQRLTAFAPVEKILLFGSRARGDHGPDSDYDVCVVLGDDITAGTYTPITLWQQVSDVGLPIQIVPIRESVFRTAQHRPGSISHEIARDSIVLYEHSTPTLAP